jgi:tetratricopeptide (TPR) repeat protein
MLARLSVALLVSLAASPPSRAAELPPVRPGARDVATERFAAAAAALARDRRSPDGIAALVELDRLQAELSDLAGLGAAYARAAGDPGANPEVRALARHRLALLERARGNSSRSQAHLRRLGFVTAWQVIGPFDDEGKRGHATAFPPEAGIDLSARYPGKLREVAWRTLSREAVGQGFIHLGATLRPAREVAAYALAVVNAPRDERVQLWFGGSGAAKVLVNGAVAIDDPTYHPARLDQRGALVSLRRGANRILVKLCHQDGRMGFYLRLADARGEGLHLPAGDPAAPAALPGPEPRPLDGAVPALERRAGAARGGARERARLALAAALVARGGGDRDERRAAAEAAKAARLAPRSVEAQLWAASLEEDHAARRLLVEAALRAAPADPRALHALAQEELDQGRPHAAARLLERAIRAAPGWAEPRVALAEALDRAGLQARAALLAEESARLFPTVPSVVRAAARSARRLGRVDEAIARHRTLLALRFDDAEARAALVQLLADRGDLAGAEALLREAIRLAPADVFLRLRLADLLAANGRFDAAEAAYAEALELCPEEGDALERRGRARLAAGRARDAQADLSRALELTPQSPELRELVGSLEPERERFEKPYLLDARALAAAAPAAAPDDDAIVLGELKVTRVLPSGLSATYTQAVVKVLTARGADQFRRQTVSWSPERQAVRVDRARILKAGGSVVEAHDERVQSTSEPWYRLYYDTVARTLSFPALAPGDVLEVAWRVEDVAGENLLSDYFGDITFVDEPARKARFEYVLLVPASRKIHSSASAGIAHARRDLPGGLVEHRFSARDVPRLVREPGMPGWSEVSRSVHVSTYESWDQVNDFYWRLVRDQLRPGPEVRATALRIAEETLRRRGVEPGAPFALGGVEGRPSADRETRLALVRAVYDFVVSQTRYVGLEFGIHGFKPYRVDQVLSRRFGDCKDKASLMHALLGSLGIDSRLVLLRMRRLGQIPERPASLAVFNHAILYVPELDLWLDGTAAYSGSRDLPGDDRGASVLVVNPDGPPRFGRIPEARPEENRFESRLEIALAPEGTATVRGGWQIAGVEAPSYRRAYLVENERQAQLEQVLNRAFPGVRVEQVRVSDLARIEEDVSMQFELTVPRYAQPDSGGLRFTPFGAARGYTDAYASLSRRRHDLDLGGPRETVFTYRHVLPAGWRVVELPEPVSAEGLMGGYSVRYREEGGALVAEGHVRLAAGRIAARDYPQFRELMGSIDRALARWVRIAPAASAAVGGPSARASGRGPRAAGEGAEPPLRGAGARSAPQGPARGAGATIEYALPRRARGSAGGAGRHAPWRLEVAP